MDNFIQLLACSSKHVKPNFGQTGIQYFRSDPDSDLEDDDGQQGGCLEDQDQGRNKILSFSTISPISSAYDVPIIRQRQ